MTDEPDTSTSPGTLGVLLCRYREPRLVHTRGHVDERLDGDLDRLAADRGHFGVTQSLPLRRTLPAPVTTERRLGALGGVTSRAETTRHQAPSCISAENQSTGVVLPTLLVP